jgi:hypothetical protein
MGALVSMEPLVHAAASELHGHLAAIACVLLTVAALFWWDIHTLSFLFGRGQADRQLHCPTGPPGAGTAGSVAEPPQALHFVPLFIGMGVALHAEALVAAAAELRLHPAVVVVGLLGVAALFNWAIQSVHFRVARWSAEGESKTAPRALASAEAAPTRHAPRPQKLHRLVVLCLAMAAALNAEPLVAAAADLGIHSSVVAYSLLTVNALFNWEILSLNVRVAHQQAGEHHHKMLIQPASAAPSAARSSRPARLAFLVLAAVVPASSFVEPFAAAAEHCVPKAAVAAIVLLFAAVFSVWTHIFHSFLHCSPSLGAAAAQRLRVGAITAGVTAVGIGIAACLVGAVGSA